MRTDGHPRFAVWPVLDRMRRVLYVAAVGVAFGWAAFYFECRHVLRLHEATYGPVLGPSPTFVNAIYSVFMPEWVLMLFWCVLVATPIVGGLLGLLWLIRAGQPASGRAGGA
jgi:hypothetical protein